MEYFFIGIRPGRDERSHAPVPSAPLPACTASPVALTFCRLKMHAVLPLFGRLLFALIFLVSGVTKVVNFSSVHARMDVQGLPLAMLLLLGAIVVEVVGALLLIAGLRMRWTALLLFFYLIPTTLIFHSDFGNAEQAINFLKNLAIMGGLLFAAAHGPGAVSMDAQRVSEHEESGISAPFT
jgi:uncharacterized membrane protein YphA (DoxX/SURF4 family)